MIKILLSFYALFAFIMLSKAQVVSVDPPFPTVNDEITITFNATLGTGGLAGITPVYAHTGLITENSADPNDWQYVVSAWGIPNPVVLMTDIGNNLHEITFTIADYYGVPASEAVLQMAFVFRNADGSAEGKGDDGGNIYLDVFNTAFTAAITEPFGAEIFTEAPSALSFTGSANLSSTITLFLDDAELVSASDLLSLNTILDMSGFAQGQYWLWMEANSGVETVTDSTYVIIQGSPNISAAPAGIVDGINYMDDETVILQLFAPFKDFVYVLGDFNQWQFDLDYFMNQTPDGDHYWLQIDDLNPGQEYRFQYSIDQMDMRVADIYADKILDPFNDPFIPASVYPDLIDYPTGLTSEIVSVLQTAQQPYAWESSGYVRPDQENLVIYELLVRDFDEDRSYQNVIDRLPYLDRLGINAIELMPFTEFEGNESWGYNPMFYFAPDKYYGTKNDLKALIDSCHNRGIAVIQDVVLNHSFGQNPQLRMYSQSNGASGTACGQLALLQRKRHPSL